MTQTAPECLRDQLTVRQAAGNELRRLGILKDAVSSKRVEVHPRHLPRRIPSDPRPILLRQRQRRQHLERNVRHVERLAALDLRELSDNFRQCALINQPRGASPGVWRLQPDASAFRLIGKVP